MIGSTATRVPLFGFTHVGIIRLVNMLFELGILMESSDFDIDTSWRPAGHDNSYRMCDERREVLAWIFPKLQREEAIPLRAPYWVEWMHTLPQRSDLHSKAILMVRDPRDAIYSAYQRAAPDGSFIDFLREPMYCSDPQYSRNFSLRPADEWALYYGVIPQLYPSDRLCTVRFEDLVRDGAGELARVLRFLKIERSEEEIAAAADASTHANVRAAAVAWGESQGIEVGERFMRKGEAGEWKEIWSAAHLDQLAGLPAFAAATMGYSIASTTRRAPADLMSTWSAHCAEILTHQCGNYPISEFSDHVVDSQDCRLLLLPHLIRHGRWREALVWLKGIQLGEGLSFWQWWLCASAYKALQHWKGYRIASEKAEEQAKREVQFEALVRLRRWERDPFRRLRSQIVGFWRETLSF